jgi:hypothetical protein
VILSSAGPDGGVPADLTLTAADAGVPLGPLTPFGSGPGDAMVRTFNFWQVKANGGFLPASSDLVLSASDGNGGRVTLTTIRTAAGYDKQPGTPATLKSLTLTRVRYPISEIGSGDCVFSEYIGYISFESDPASIPGTPADSVVNTITLRPRYGGAADQSRTFTGATSYTGEPAGALSSAPSSEWLPYLDPTLEYCAGIRSFGYGDIARLPVDSNVLCVRVNEVSPPGARVDDAGAAVLDAGVDAPSAQDDAAPGDAAADHHHFVAGDGPPTCGVAGGRTAPSPFALVLLSLALRRRRAGTARRT